MPRRTRHGRALNRSDRRHGVLRLEPLEPRLLLSVEYSISALAELGGGFSLAEAINESGQITGWGFNASFEYAGALWQDGQMAVLPNDSFGGNSCTPIDINGSGAIAGSMADGSWAGHAFLYQGGQMLPLYAYVSGDPGMAMGINDAGQVVGYSHGADDNQYPFLWDAVNGADIFDDYGRATDLNESGLIVGSTHTPSDSDDRYPCIWVNGQADTLEAVPQQVGEASAVNEAGKVVGWWIGVFGHERPFVWTSTGGAITLGTFGGNAARAHDINDAGQVVGFAQAASGEKHAFLYENHMLRDLNDLVPADSGFSVLYEATGITNDGRIVGYGRTAADDATVPFLLTPLDLEAPTATLDVADLTQRSSSPHPFTVTYTDNVGIYVAGINLSDIRVTGPGGFNELAPFIGLDSPGNGTPRTATYWVEPPGGDWGHSDNGVYTLSVVAGEVVDTSGNPVPAGALGTFTVDIPAGPAAGLHYPADGAKVAQAAINASPSGNGIIEVTFTDASGTGLDAATITDAAAEFTLSGSAAAGVSVDPCPTPVGETTWRYSFTGPFGLGDVEVHFIPGAWADNTGATNEAETESFTVVLTDTSGPYVLGHEPLVLTEMTLDFVDVTFDKAVNLGTFTAADVTVTDPDDAPVSVKGVSHLGGTAYRITIAPQWDAGAYTVRVGPAIQDLYGNLMNQDHDGLKGEAGDDVYVGAVHVPPDLMIVDHTPSGRQFGEVAALDITFNQPILDATFTLSDVFLTGPAGPVDLASLTHTSGNTWRLAFAEPQTRAGEYLLQVGVAIENLRGSRLNQDGDLLAGELDDDAYMGTFAIAQSELRITAHDPTGVVSNAVDHLDVTFSETINGNTLTADDVAITGPSGAIAPTGIQHVGGNVYRVLFPEQTAEGTYMAEVGPDIETPLGSRMNQDRDATPGEPAADSYFAIFLIDASASAGNWIVIDLGTLGGVESKAYGINDLGQVVGVAETAAGEDHAFIWDPADGQMHDLGTLGGDYSVAFDINNSEHIVGTASPADGSRRATQWIGRSPSMMGAAPWGIVPVAINDAGLTVGNANPPRLWNGASWDLLNDYVVSPVGWRFTSAGDVDAGGSIVGHGYWPPPNGNGEEGACVMAPSGLVNYTTSLDAYAVGINPCGTIITGYYRHTAFEKRACIWDNGTFCNINTWPDITNSEAYAVNDDGRVVGYTEYYGVWDAFIYEGGAMHAIEDYVGTGQGFATYVEAYDVNERGEVVGWGHTSSTGRAHAFLMTREEYPRPTAELDDPQEDTLVAVGDLNARGTLDVFFRDDGQTGLRGETIRDTDPEFILRGQAATGVALTGTPTRVHRSAEGETWRYAFTGTFSPGVVDIEFIAGSWTDQRGLAGERNVQSFTVGLDPDDWDIDAPTDGHPGNASDIALDEFQVHNIHIVGDEDWATFTLDSRTSIVLKAVTETDMLKMTLYGPDDPAREVAWSVVSPPLPHPRILCAGTDALEPGTYWVKVEEFGGNDTAGTYELFLEEVEVDNYAVLFSGGIDRFNNHLRYYESTRDLYLTLVNDYGLDPEKIIVLFGDGTNPAWDTVERTDFGPLFSSADMSFAVDRGSTVVSATAPNLLFTLTLMAEVVDPTDHFFFWTFDHGAGTKGNPAVTGEEELRGWQQRIDDDFVADLLAEIHAAHSTYVYCQCFSGGILDDSMPLDRGEFGCAATNHYEVSWSNAFTWGFDLALRSGIYLTHQIYRFAYLHDFYATDGEGPGGAVKAGAEHPWMTGDNFPIFYDPDNQIPTLSLVAPLKAKTDGANCIISHDLLSAAANATDPEGRALGFRIEAVTCGTLTKHGAPVVPGVTTVAFGESLEWEPPPGASGTVEAFTTTAFDGVLASASPVPVEVQLDPGGGPAAAADDEATIDEDALSYPINVLGNDAGDGALHIVRLGSPLRGTVELDGNFIRYTPAPNLSGHDSFSYVMADALGNTDMATVDVTIEAANDAPKAYADAPTVTNDGTGHLLDVLENDRDAEGDSLTLTGAGPADHGTAVVDASQIRYTPEEDYAGDDSFTYTVSDGNGGTATGTVLVTVEPVYDVAVAIGDGGARQVTCTDADGTETTIALKGGTATVYFAGGGLTQEAGRKGVAVTGGAAQIVLIQITGTTAKSSLTVKTKGGDGTVDVHTITADGSLKQISAKTTQLIGNIAIGGWCGKLLLADVADDHAITLGGTPDDKPITFIAGHVQDLAFASGAPVKAFTALDWLDTDATPDTFAAPSLGSLTTKGRKANARKAITAIAGDFEASLDLDGTGNPKYVLAKAKIAGSVTKGTWAIAGTVGSIVTGLDFCADLDALSVKSMSVKRNLDGAAIHLTQTVDPRLKALAKLAVTGWTRNTAVTAAGHVAKFQTGGMDGSTLFLGVVGTELPDEAGDFIGGETLLKSFTVKGIKDGKTYLDSFLDSDVAAWCITKATLREVVTDNTGDPFGFAWCELKSLTWRQGGDKFKWPEKKPTDWPDGTGDLVIRTLA